MTKYYSIILSALLMLPVVAGASKADNLKNDNNRFVVRNLDINTKQQDFSAVYYKDRIVYTTSNNSKPWIKRDWNVNSLPFLSIFSATTDENGDFKNQAIFNKKANFKYHDGTVAFNKEGNFMVFTRNYLPSANSDEISKLKLMSCELIDGEWCEPVEFTFNNKEYSVGQPALTADDKTLYFVSDMPGGFGGTDIYKSEKTENGWSKPENLGADINTSGNEMFPFIHNTGILFFASNGHKGLGGLDVFMAELNNNKYSVSHLDSPINSNEDDFAFILNSNQKSGYFSSNRTTGKGNDDIYYYNNNSPFVYQVSGVASNNAGEKLIGATVELKNEKGEVIIKTTTDENGYYKFTTSKNGKYSVDAKKEGYANTYQNIELKNNADLKNDFVLEQEINYSIICQVNDKKSNTPLNSVNIDLLAATGEIINSIISDERGIATQVLDNYKKGDSAKLTIKLSKEGYVTKEATVDIVLANINKIEIANVIDCNLDKLELGADIGKLMNVNPIYFDLNKANIRPDAAKELDKVVEFLNQNTKIVIELGSHSDSRGSNTYNLQLSDKRAKSAADYIKSRITDSKRISGKGYGETEPLNKCKDGVKCSEEEHSENRRTEFKIAKIS